MEWFIDNRPDLKRNIASMEVTGVGSRRMLALGYATMGKFEPRDKLRRILTKLLDENEFLSDHGIRSVSKIHAQNPYTFTTNGQTYHISYDPAESTSGIFGGNSNWRGPIWFPLNYLIIESLQQFHSYLGDAYQVECPTGSGRWLNLADVATAISQRLIRLFEQDPAGNRPVNGDRQLFQTDPHWQDLIQFYEYFHGDNGTGLGASHQTGWTAIIANLLQQQAESTKD
jgi:Glycosyl hydrolase family 63 C-terminal domain